MKNLDVIGEELFAKIRGRFPEVTIGNDAGEVVSDPTQARFFDFDFLKSRENTGRVSISISEDDGLTVIYSNDFITNEDSITQQKWYDFLKELRFFAKKRLLNFDTRNITKSNLDRRDYKFLAQNRAGEEQMNESKLYGTSQTSYQDMDGARLIIKHTRPVNTEKAAGRTQHVGKIYIESAEGERFKYPFKHLNGARAMARHVAEGGNAYDDFGKHIVGLSEEMSKLRKFKNYMGRSAVMAESLAGYMDIVKERISTVKKTVERLQKPNYYREAFDNFETPVFEEVPEDVRENWIDELTIRQFNEELKDVFPYIYRLVGEATRAKELGPEELEEAFVEEYKDPEGRFKVLYDYDKRAYVAMGSDEYKNKIEPQQFDKLDHAIEHAEEELRLDGDSDDQDLGNSAMDDVDEGKISDLVRRKNYKRLARRSQDKATDAMMKATDFDFSDLDNREEHEDEFMRQMAKNQERIKRAKELGDKSTEFDDIDYSDDWDDLEEYEKKKGVDGKACWKGYRYAGKEKKSDGTYKDKCVKVEDQYEAELDKLMGQFGKGGNRVLDKISNASDPSDAIEKLLRAAGPEGDFVRRQFDLTAGEQGLHGDDDYEEVIQQMLKDMGIDEAGETMGPDGDNAMAVEADLDKLTGQFSEDVCQECGNPSWTTLGMTEQEIEEGERHGNSKIYNRCWKGYRKVPGKKAGEKGSCKKIESDQDADEGNAYAHAVRKAKMDGKKKGDKIKGPNGDKITLEKEGKTPLGEFILSYYDRQTGEFPKGETAVLTSVEKDYGDKYIEPAKQFIEKINQTFEQYQVNRPKQDDNFERMRELAGLK